MSRYCAQWFSTFAIQGSAINPYRVTFALSIGPRCTCPSFKFNAEKGEFWCKHVRRIMEHACMWNEQWYGGGDKKIQPEPNTCSRVPLPFFRCPNCGGPVVPI